MCESLTFGDADMRYTPLRKLLNRGMFSLVRQGLATNVLSLNIFLDTALVETTNYFCAGGRIDRKMDY